MLNHRPSPDVIDRGNPAPLVALAIDKDKGSQCALKWAVENVVTKGQTLTLIHVNTKSSGKIAFHNDFWISFSYNYIKYVHQNLFQLLYHVFNDHVKKKTKTIYNNNILIFNI